MIASRRVRLSALLLYGSPGGCRRHQ